MSALAAFYLYPKLDVKRDADWRLYEAIVTSTHEYRRGAPATLDHVEIAALQAATDASKAETVGRWVRQIKTLADAKGAGPAASDFLERFRVAFLSGGTLDSPPYYLQLTGTQALLPVHVLKEVHNEIFRTLDPLQLTALLLSRTPYVLFERMQKTWVRVPHQHRGAPELPFPPQLFSLYPERIELVRLLDTTAPVVWPKHDDPLPSGSGWSAIVTCVHQSLRAALLHKDKVPEGFELHALHKWTATCLAGFTTEAARIWYNSAMYHEQHALARVVNAIYAEASWYGDTRGAIYTIRHLHQYTSHGLNEHLRAISDDHVVSPFPDSEGMHEHAHMADILSAHSVGSFRRDLIYKRHQRLW